MRQEIRTPVCIIGAGPAGCAAALKLDRLGIDCVLVEKSHFPRDKVCGDAISGKVIVNLKRIDPDLLRRFYAMPWKQDIYGIRIVLPDRARAVDLRFKPAHYFGKDYPPGFTARRLDFDNWLADEVRQCARVQFLEDTNLTQFVRMPDGFVLSDAAEQVRIRAGVVLDASGARSSFARHMAGIRHEAGHTAASVRAYFRNVGGFSEEKFIEIHYLKELTPGYFWIFPLAGNTANVGIGMRTDYIKKRKVNLRKTVQQIVKDHPGIRERFADATQETDWIGHGLPLGSKRYPISGERYLLAGDAAHLVDPLSGEGIGHAFYSGVFAAEQVQACMQAGDYSAAFMRAYDARIRRVIGKEMQLSYRMQRLLNYPLLTRLVTDVALSNRKLVASLADMFSDFELRKQLVKPGFWLRHLLRR